MTNNLSKIVGVVEQLRYGEQPTSAIRSALRDKAADLLETLAVWITELEAKIEVAEEMADALQDVVVLPISRTVEIERALDALAKWRNNHEN